MSDARSLGREWPWYDPATVEQCRDLIARGRTFDYYHGPELAALETAFADRAGRKHALAFNSGTSALLAAYTAVGVHQGDEVLVPTFTFLSTASPLFLLGAVPVLCDSGDEFGNVTAGSLEPHITAKTRAIAVTHLWGQPCEMAPILALARERDLPVIADCSHAHGSTYNGEDIGRFGDLAVFSLGTHKIVSGGLGGILLCDDDLHFDVACLLGHFKQRRLSITTPDRAQFADIGLGGNLRISPIAAVLSQSHLQALGEIMKAKSANVRQLADAVAEIPGIERLPEQPSSSRDGWYGCVLRTEPEGSARRDKLISQLVRAGVPITAPLTGLLHLTSIFAGHRSSEPQLAQRLSLPPERSYRHGDLPLSEGLFSSWLSLPTTFLHGEPDEFLAACLCGVERVIS